MSHEPGKSPIGSVTWYTGGLRRVAILRSDRSWDVLFEVPTGEDDAGPTAMEPQPDLAGGFRLTRSDAYAGPSDGPYGAKILRELARQYGGTVHLEPRPPDPPGVIY